MHDKHHMQTHIMNTPMRNAVRGSNSFLVFLACSFCSLGLVDQANAQLPTARLHYVYPSSGKIGTTVDVTIGGADLDEATELIFSNPKLSGKVKQIAATEFSAAKPIANQFLITIPADVEAGVYEVRANGRFGLSTPRRFVVNSENELVCNDQNKTIETAMPISVGSAVNGRAVANGRHFYKFALKNNEKVTIECQTRIIDSKMNPVVVLSDLTGKEIARSRSANLSSSAIYFKAPRESQYVVEVRDALFAGGAENFYRLRVSNKPHISTVYPNVIKQDSTQDLTLYGWNLPSGTEQTDHSRRNQFFETLSISSSKVVRPKLNSAEMPLSPTSYQLQWSSVGIIENGKLKSNTLPIFLSQNPIVVEDTTKEVTSVKLPVDITGRFSPGTEDDVYQFSAKSGEVYFIDAYSHRLGYSSDLILTIQQEITDGNGVKSWKNISVVDDLGNRAATTGPDFTTSTDDPSLRFQVPADGTYRIALKDQFGIYAKDFRSAYRLSIRKPEPNFNLVCMPVVGRAANANQIVSKSLSLRKGGRINIPLRLERIDGFTGQVSVKCENLPPGVTCPPVTFTQTQTSNDLVFFAAENAAAGNSIIKIIGVGKNGEKELIHNAVTTVVLWETGNKTTALPFFRRTAELEISVLPSTAAPVAVAVGDGKTLETSLGGKISVPVKLTRRNFAEVLKLTCQNLPGQLKPADLTIAKDKSDAAFEIFVKDKNTKVGTYRFTQKGDAKFKFSRNPEAATRAEGELKRLEDWSKKTTQEKTDLTAALAAAAAKMPTIDTEIAAAKTASSTIQKSLDENNKLIGKLDMAITSAKAAAEKNIDPLILQAAESHLKLLRENIAAKTNGKLKPAIAQIAALEKSKSDTAAMIAGGNQKLAAIDTKQKLIDAEKAAAKKDFDNFKKLSLPKDLFYVALSNPVNLKIVSSPIVVEPVTQPTATIESAAKAIVKIARKYGFADSVTLTLKSTNTVKGLVFKPVTIAKDKTEIPVEISILKDCPPGDHTIEIIASAKFNNVDVQTKTSFVLKVNAAAAK